MNWFGGLFNQHPQHSTIIGQSTNASDTQFQQNYQNALAQQNAAAQFHLGQMQYQPKPPSRFQHFYGSLVYFGEKSTKEILRYK